MGEGARVESVARGACAFGSFFVGRAGANTLEYMERALDLAARALGWCSPNPAVGAVLVRDGSVVGEGFTQLPGSAHAEIMALRAAGDAAQGATLYVTLEPCCHHGRTPPCTDALLAAGVRSVHIAMLDPSPWVNGGGARALESAGVEVHVGESAEAARRLNEGYLKWVRSGLPFVTLKYAMTADGKSATRTGSSFWITGMEARRYVARLRARADAVLVGIGTVLADDPQLTARPAEFGDEQLDPVHQPLRVILDSRARLPTTARVVSGGLPGTTLLCTTGQAPADRLRALADLGVEVLVVAERDGLVDVADALKALGEREVTSLLVEAGGAVAWSLLAARAVDKVVAFIAPKLVGGADARSPLEGLGVAAMSEAVELVDSEWSLFGRDIALTGYPTYRPLEQACSRV